MRTFFSCVLVCILVLGLTAPAIAQTTGKILVVGVPDLFSAANNGETTYGITNVGVGARVVLKAQVWTGLYTKYNDSVLTVTSATWTVTGPKGAVTVTDTTAAGNNGTIVYFKPDTSGVFNVTMNATTARGAATAATMRFTAANFKGVGIYNPSTKVWDNSNCATCHDQNAGVWGEFKKTKHATVFPPPRGRSWRPLC